MSRKGDCWVNAPTESLWGRLKAGRLYGRKFETRRQAMDEVIDWLTFYNHRRLHSALGYVSPMLFEKKLARGTSIEGRTMEWLKKGTSNRGMFSCATPRRHLSNKFQQMRLVNYYMSVTFFVVMKSVNRC